jgi:carbon monoxide dehydrogenase subunit G
MASVEPFSGVESLPAPPERVYAFLTDPDKMKTVVPDLVSAEKTAPNILKGVVKPGFSFIRGTLKFTMTIAEKTPASGPGKEALVTIFSEAIGAKMTVESTMRVEPDGPSASKVHWTAQVTQLSGLIAAVPGGLIKAAADKTVRDGWEKVRAALG